MAIIDELLELEHAGWRSLCEGSGAAFYGAAMTEDAVMVLAHGFAMDRTAVAASLDGAPPWSEYAIEEPRLVSAGEDAWALVYRGRARREGEEDGFDALMSSVYVRVRDRWRLALYQQTPVPPAG
jgi:hypothetical protein